MPPLWMLSLPSPDPMPQPAPTGLLWGLLLLTFFLHLIPMNLTLGGSILALVARWRGRDRRDPCARTLAAWYARALPTLIATTVSFGVAPLLFVQVLYGRALFGSSVLMAWPWLSVVALLTVAYCGAYRLAFRAGDAAKAEGVLAVVITLIFVAIAFIYTNNMSLMLRAGAFEAMTTHGTPGWRLNLDDRTLAPRYLHILLGAIAVAGAGTALLGWWRRARDAAFATWAMRYGSGWAAVATFVNLFVGSWWLMALPRDVLQRLAGRDAVATIVLMFGIAVALVALMAFAAAARATDPAQPVLAGLSTLPIVLVAMVFTRDQVRESSFLSAGLGDATWVEPQWGPIAIFVVLLPAALATIAWMLLALVRGK